MAVEVSVRMIKTYAIITLQKEGFHQYINAPLDVAFLRSLHRHLFHITVKIDQFHDNRDIEYIKFKRYLEATINFDRFDHSWSCEMIAKTILDMINHQYPNRYISVKVMEDGENGAEVEYIE